MSTVIKYWIIGQKESKIMGGRGSTSGGMTGGGTVNVVGSESLVSAREGKQAEVDQVLSVARDIENQYGVTVTELQVVQLKNDRGTMAYYDSSGNLAINESYFDAKKMDSAYDSCVKSGFHPPRGNRTGLEAVTAHELGHRLTDVAGMKAGDGNWAIDKTSNSIIAEAKRRLGAKSVESVRNSISGYAKQNNAEAIAEAFADVYCNGNKARRESTTVVNILGEYLRR